MRTVFNSHAEVCKEFASLQGAERFTREGRAGNIFFEGGKLYSYGRHFVIAQYAKDANGDVCVLFTERGYSNSTSKHIGRARAAFRGQDVVGVASLDGDNVAELWANELTGLANKYARARTRKEWYLRDFTSTVANVKRYYAFLGQAIDRKLEQVATLGLLSMNTGIALKDLP